MVGTNLSKGAVRASEIGELVQGLSRGDRVIVVWHDACRVNNDPDVRSDYYATKKETQGTVYDCLPDPEYPNVFYLIISGETTGGRPDYYDSIPIAWIAEIQKLERSALAVSKTPKKISLTAPDVTSVERAISYKDGKIQEDSGGIAKLARKWTHPILGTRKFTEEIIKTIA